VDWGSNRKIGFALNRTNLISRVVWLYFSRRSFTFHIKQAASCVIYIILTQNSCLQACIFIKTSKALLDIVFPISLTRELNHSSTCRRDNDL
jgi:hypothetical protein